MPEPIVSDDGLSTPDASGVTPSDSSQTVKYESYKKLLDQKKAQDDKLREQNEKLARFEAAENEKREELMRSEKRHDEIIAEYKLRNAELEAKAAKTQADIANSLKQQALERVVGGFAQPEYAQFANLASISFGEDGNVDADSLAREATRLREKHPHLLKQTQSPIPSGSPQTAFDPSQKLPAAVSYRDAAEAFMNKKGK